LRALPDLPLPFLPSSYLGVAILATLILRNIVLSAQRLIARRSSQDVVAGEKGVKSAGSILYAKKPALLRASDRLDAFLLKPVYGSSWTRIQVALTLLILALNIAFCLVRPFFSRLTLWFSRLFSCLPRRHFSLSPRTNNRLPRRSPTYTSSLLNNPVLPSPVLSLVATVASPSPTTPSSTASPVATTSSPASPASLTRFVRFLFAPHSELSPFPFLIF
jgi:hypothetical protein